MRPSPYRRLAHREEASIEADVDACPDADLAIVLLVLWISSVARVVVGAPKHGGMDTEGTLAFLTVFVVPVLLRGAIAWLCRRALLRMRSRGRS